MGVAGILSHKGAYNTLFTVRCMVTEHMSKVPLGTLNEKSTGKIKAILNEQIEKKQDCHYDSSYTFSCKKCGQNHRSFGWTYSGTRNTRPVTVK